MYVCTLGDKAGKPSPTDRRSVAMWLTRYRQTRGRLSAMDPGGSAVAGGEMSGPNGRRGRSSIHADKPVPTKLWRATSSVSILV
jgi:hypothetical protein